jgi:hypothetical protein
MYQLLTMIEIMEDMGFMHESNQDAAARADRRCQGKVLRGLI